GSMADKLGNAKEAAIQFFKTANPQDEFFLVGFNERAELLSPFTDSVEDLQGRIFSVPAKGRTALLDAIYLGLSEMKGAHHAKRDRKSTRLNSSHGSISYAVFCLKKKTANV